MDFVKKRIINVPNLLFIHLFVFVQNPGRLEESPAFIARSLARGRRMKEMEKFFIFRDPRGIGMTKKNRFFFLLYLSFLTSTT